jgi:HTH-type transcriptional regulator/antitoxin HipB
MLTARSLGQAIRRRRVAAGLTQRQLAAACGVGERFVVELEKGKESCRLGLALRVADAIGLMLEVDTGASAMPSRTRVRSRRP